MRTLVTFTILIALWLLMSGLYTTFIVGLGIGSALVVLIVIGRMNAVDGDQLEFGSSPIQLVKYQAWLFLEIARSNWAVTKTILAPKPRIRQHLFMVPADQKTDLALVVFANSITLTPGTITVETEPGQFLVHALDYDDEARDGILAMGERVRKTEFGGRP